MTVLCCIMLTRCAELVGSECPVLVPTQCWPMAINLTHCPCNRHLKLIWFQCSTITTYEPLSMTIIIFLMACFQIHLSFMQFYSRILCHIYRENPHCSNTRCLTQKKFKKEHERVNVIEILFHCHLTWIVHTLFWMLVSICYLWIVVKECRLIM